MYMHACIYAYVCTCTYMCIHRTLTTRMHWRMFEYVPECAYGYIFTRIHHKHAYKHLFVLFCILISCILYYITGRKVSPEKYLSRLGMYIDTFIRIYFHDQQHIGVFIYNMQNDYTHVMYILHSAQQADFSLFTACTYIYMYVHIMYVHIYICLHIYTYYIYVAGTCRAV